jgi:hypothetical protein
MKLHACLPLAALVILAAPWIAKETEGNRGNRDSLICNRDNRDTGYGGYGYGDRLRNPETETEAWGRDVTRFE